MYQNKEEDGIELVFGSEESRHTYENSQKNNKSDKKSGKKSGLEFVEEEAHEPENITVPEKFTVDKKYEESSHDNSGVRLIRTYVPHFTEASEKFHMAAAAKKLKKDRVKVEVTKDDSTLDPTAEIDLELQLSDAVNVTTGNVKPDELESATKVFKFNGGEQQSESEEKSKTAEEVFSEKSAPENNQEEPADIKNTSEEDAEQNSDAEETDGQNAEAATKEKKEYTVPDPVTESVGIVSYVSTGALMKSTTLSDAPEGIGDPISTSKKKKHAEYISYAERDYFKDKFLDTIMSIKVRFFAALAFVVLLLVSESMYAFGVNIPQILSLASIPGAMALIDAQLVLCLFLLSINEVVSSFKSLAKGKVSAELYLTVSLVVYLIYTLVVCLRSPEKYQLFGLLYGLAALSAIAGTYFRKTSDFTGFKVMSVNGEKEILDIKLTRTLERENAALDGLVEEHKSKICRMFKTIFVTDFFKKCLTFSENSIHNLIVIGSAFGVSFVAGAVAFFVFDGWISAASTMTFVFMMATPTVLVLTHKIAYFYSQKEAENQSSAIFGEAAIGDYAGVDVVTFKDTEVFGREDVNLQRIMLYNSSDEISKALRQMSSLFMNVGGPLDLLFSDSLDRKCAPAENVEIDFEGLSGDVEGKRIHAGTLKYMIDQGVRIPADATKVDNTISNSTRIMYAAENGVVYAKFFIRYSFSEEFSMLIPSFEEEGIKPLVYTRDPNVNNELLKILTGGADKIRVLKKKNNNSEDNTVYRKVSAGIVTTGDKTGAIGTLLLTKRYVRLMDRITTTELIAMIVGAALAVLCSLGGVNIVPSVILALWQGAWCGVVWFLSRRTLITQNTDKG